MPLEKYRALVDRLEDYAARHPMGYRLRLAGLAALGYLYIFGLLAVFVALTVVLGAAVVYGSLAFIKLAIPLVILAFAVARALWVKVDAPQGRRLQRVEAPELFAFLDEIRDEMGAPAFHEVIVSPEFNAAVTQVPRLGIFGWQKNYLMIGLPLMMTLSPEEFRAVIAHELGHLSGNHSKFATWIYRVRMSWFRLVGQLDQGKTSFLVRRFFNWFVPYFGAYSFVLARMNEYEADRASAEVAGAQTAGRALARVHVAGDHLSETFWPQIYRRNDRSDDPPRQLFVEMGEELAASSDSEDAEVHLARQLERPSGLNDTHPSLGLRLEALGVEPSVPAPAERSAADALMSECCAGLLEEFNHQWYTRVCEPWQLNYEQAQEGLERLEELEGALGVPGAQVHGEADESAGSSSLDQVDDEELFEFAQLVERFHGADQALGVYERLVERDPQNAAARFAVGRLLLDDEDADGLVHLRAAIDCDERYSADGGYLIAGYYLGREDYASAQPWLDKAELYEQKLFEARRERDQVLPADVFFPHDLDAEVAHSLRAQLEQFPQLDSAFLAAKQVEHFPDDPVYILGVRTGGIFASAVEGQRLVSEIAQGVSLSVRLLIFDVGRSESKWLRKKLERVPGSKIV